MSDTLKIPQLEELCPACKGKGLYAEVDEKIPCYKCNGSGYVPTKEGLQIIALIRHNSRITIEADLQIASGQ